MNIHDFIKKYGTQGASLMILHSADILQAETHERQKSRYENGEKLRKMAIDLRHSLEDFSSSMADKSFHDLDR